MEQTANRTNGRAERDCKHKTLAHPLEEVRVRVDRTKPEPQPRINQRNHEAAERTQDNRVPNVATMLWQHSNEEPNGDATDED
jgi:hypothetical protein